jgi:hypothetical protein
MVGGDMNLTLSIQEVFGVPSQTGSQSGFFSSLFEKPHLVDIDPTKLVPTWMNFRTRENAISKRLDRFFILELMIKEGFLVKPSVEEGGLSDHRPILLSISIGNEILPALLKFNPV